jgi:DNA polymerase V
MRLKAATQDTRIIVSEAHHLLKALFRPGYRYQKCGVQLSDIQAASIPGQIDLFDMTAPIRQAGSQALMQAMDRINRRFPKSIAVAATGFDKAWQSKVERLSPRYTTDWRELLSIRCS